jgi:acyl-CoA synthetase (AMP-forming)/AMP-acid ligase II
MARWSPPLGLQSITGSDARRPELGPWAADSMGANIVTAAQRYGARTALWVDGTVFTYQDLYGHAAGIAGALGQAPTAARNKHCAILAARSMPAYAGVMGSALAGAVYVPLNPRYPLERLLYMLTAAEADAIVIDQTSTHRARSVLEAVGHPLRVLLPDATSAPDWATALPTHRFLCRDDLEACRPAFAPAHVGQGGEQRGAYLMFTSGSTGAPKGVLI